MKHLTTILTALIERGHSEAVTTLAGVALGGTLATLGLLLTLWLS